MLDLLPGMTIADHRVIWCPRMHRRCPASGASTPGCEGPGQKRIILDIHHLFIWPQTVSVAALCPQASPLHHGREPERELLPSGHREHKHLKLHTKQILYLSCALHQRLSTFTSLLIANYVFFQPSTFLIYAIYLFFHLQSIMYCELTSINQSWVKCFFQASKNKPTVTHLDLKDGWKRLFVFSDEQKENVPRKVFGDRRSLLWLTNTVEMCHCFKAAKWGFLGKSPDDANLPTAFGEWIENHSCIFFGHSA